MEETLVSKPADSELSWFPRDAVHTAHTKVGNRQFTPGTYRDAEYSTNLRKRSRTTTLCLVCKRSAKNCDSMARHILHPSAQGILLASPADCLEVIEKAVNWEAEKLYGVEGLGPFDEF